MYEALKASSRTHSLNSTTLHLKYYADVRLTISR